MMKISCFHALLNKCSPLPPTLANSHEATITKTVPEKLLVVPLFNPLCNPRPGHLYHLATIAVLQIPGRMPYQKLFISIAWTVSKATRTYALIKLFVLVHSIFFFFFLGGEGRLVIFGHYLEIFGTFSSRCLLHNFTRPILTSRPPGTPARHFTACCLMANKQLIMTGP